MPGVSTQRNLPGRRISSARPAARYTRFLRSCSNLRLPSRLPGADELCPGGRRSGLRPQKLRSDQIAPFPRTRSAVHRPSTALKRSRGRARRLCGRPFLAIKGALFGARRETACLPHSWQIPFLAKLIVRRFAAHSPSVLVHRPLTRKV
jgi:hypothetical protein